MFDQMNRREFITLLGGAAVAWPLAAGAQQATVPASRLYDGEWSGSATATTGPCKPALVTLTVTGRVGTGRGCGTISAGPGPDDIVYDQQDRLDLGRGLFRERRRKILAPEAVLLEHGPNVRVTRAVRFAIRLRSRRRMSLISSTKPRPMSASVNLLHGR
jgi:hypothetical protein